MAKKIEKCFVDYGCGFPVVLHNVPMIEIRGVLTPDINYNELNDKVFAILASRPGKLLECQIKFIKNYVENIESAEYDGVPIDIDYSA